MPLKPQGNQQFCLVTIAGSQITPIFSVLKQPFFPLLYEWGTLERISWPVIIGKLSDFSPLTGGTNMWLFHRGRPGQLTCHVHYLHPTHYLFQAASSMTIIPIFPAHSLQYPNSENPSSPTGTSDPLSLPPFPSCPHLLPHGLKPRGHYYAPRCLHCTLLRAS